MATQIEKNLHRAERAAHRAKKQSTTVMEPTIDLGGSVDCACVIHGNGYDWIYVDRLYNMLSRHLTRSVRLHVYTEPTRPVPAHMIRHDLKEWPGISGRKQSWWYKMQMFNPAHHQGQLLYFDLDTVIVNNIDWITNLSPVFFWTLQDFRSLWRPNLQKINSSVMYWNTMTWEPIWQEFDRQGIEKIYNRYRHGGDQEYLNTVIPMQKLMFFEPKSMVSWRWSALDGGINPNNRTYLKPGQGTVIGKDTSVLVLHGDPKPHEITDSVIKTNWI